MFLVFMGAWLGISALLSMIGGWRALSHRYRATDSVGGEPFRFASGSMGLHYVPVNYGSCLFITVNELGFGGRQPGTTPRGAVATP